MGFYENPTNGDLWVAANSQGVYYKPENANTFYPRREGLPTAGDAVILKAVIMDSNGDLWTGGRATFPDRNGTLFKWNKTSNQWEKVDPSLGVDPDMSVTSLFESEEHDLYVGTSRTGLYVLKHGQARFVKVTSGLPTEALGISSVFEDSFKKEIWAATYQGLYVQSVGIKFFVDLEVNPIIYTESGKKWMVANKAVTVKVDWRIMTNISINGNLFTSGDSFILDGQKYDTHTGKYTISCTTKSGKILNYYIWIQDKINPEFIATEPNIIDKYVGYINWEESRKYDVLHVYDPDNPETPLELSINVFKNDIFIDWNKTFYQEVDPITFEPKGNKIFLTPNAILKLSTKGLYCIEICDQVGNKDVYYIQMGGAERIIPDKYVKSPEPEKFPVWAMVVLSILGVGTLGGGFGWIYYYWIGPKIAEAKTKEEDEDLKDSSGNGNDDTDSF